MKSDDPRLPIQGASFGLLTHCVSVSMVFDRLAVSFIDVVVALAKLLSLSSLLSSKRCTRLGSGLGVDGGAEDLRRVVMIAQTIRASLLAIAPPP